MPATQNHRIFLFGFAFTTWASLLSASAVAQEIAGNVLPSESEKALTSHPLNITTSGPTPAMQPVPSAAFANPKTNNPTNWKTVAWESADFSHPRLVFEETTLERNGCTARPKTQSLVSGLKFLAKAVFYPIVWSR